MPIHITASFEERRDAQGKKKINQSIKKQFENSKKSIIEHKKYKNGNKCLILFISLHEHENQN